MRRRAGPAELRLRPLPDLEDQRGQPGADCAVLAELGRLMPPGHSGPVRVLEVGAGLGTMVARLMDWGVLSAGEYTLLDADRELLDDAGRWLRAWAAARGVPSAAEPDGLRVGELRVRLRHAELGDFLDGAAEAQADVLIAHAVLDLVEVPAVLPGLLRLLAPGGAYWFTINYDGESVFTPDHPADGQVMDAYHRDMDERIRYGRRPGRAGRAATCSGTCARPGRRPGPPGRRTGWSAQRRTGRTRRTRRTSWAASWTRSVTRWKTGRTGCRGPPWRAGWPRGGSG